MTAEEARRLTALVFEWDDSFGAVHVGVAIREAIAAWPRTPAGKLRRMTPSERDLWEDLNRCASGVVYADDPEHEAEMAARPPFTGPRQDDDIPF